MVEYQRLEDYRIVQIVVSDGQCIPRSRDVIKVWHKEDTGCYEDVATVFDIIDTKMYPYIKNSIIVTLICDRKV